MSDTATQAVTVTQARLGFAMRAVAVSFSGVVPVPHSWSSVYAVAHEIARRTLRNRWLAQHQPGMN